MLPSTDTLTTEAEFSDAPTGNNGMVIRTGKLFATGNYEDKNYSFDRDDLKKAVEGFEKCDVDLEHVSSLLDGKLGHVQRIWAGDDGDTLMGEVHLPQWLDNVLEDGKRKISATWDRNSKLLKGLALVRNPRVTDAALMTAAFNAGITPAPPDPTAFNATTDANGSWAVTPATFAPARHDTPSGQAALQQMHDTAVQNGAKCRVPAQMASYHEGQAMQQVHDTAVQHGATCEAVSAIPQDNAPTTVSRPSMFSRTTNRSHRMKLSEFINGKAKEEGVEIEPDDQPAEFAKQATEIAALRADLAKRETEAAEMRAAQERHAAAFALVETERRHAEAVNFAAVQVASKKISPAGAEALVPLVDRITAHDSTATFAEGDKPTSTLLAEFLATLPDMALFTVEQIKNNPSAALFNQMTTPGVDGKEKSDPAMREAMLKVTPLGRDVLAEQKSASNGTH